MSQRKLGDQLFNEETTYLEDPTTGGKKGTKICRYDMIPVEALAEIAAVYGMGERKYPSGEDGPNWERGFPYSWALSAAQRHIERFRAGEKLDPESGLHPLAHAAWHLLALITFEARGIGTDDRRGKFAEDPRAGQLIPLTDDYPPSKL